LPPLLELLLLCELPEELLEAALELCAALLVEALEWELLAAELLAPLLPEAGADWAGRPAGIAPAGVCVGPYADRFVAAGGKPGMLTGREWSNPPDGEEK